MELSETLFKYLNKTIYDWVARNFGTQEAEDPSWNIEALASDLAYRIEKDNIKFDIYRAVERGFLKDDCDMVAENMGVRLTDKERGVIVDDYMNSDAYADAHAEDWEWFIGKEIKHRKENAK